MSTKRIPRRLVVTPWGPPTTLEVREVPGHLWWKVDVATRSITGSTGRTVDPLGSLAAKILDEVDLYLLTTDLSQRPLTSEPEYTAVNDEQGVPMRVRNLDDDVIEIHEGKRASAHLWWKVDRNTRVITGSTGRTVDPYGTLSRRLLDVLDSYLRTETH